MARALFFLTFFLAFSVAICSVTLGQSEQPAPLEFTKWSGQINVPDPVAIGFDNQGRAYVTQTQRRKSQDLDIRANRSWVPNDVGFQSVQDKIDFYHRELAAGDDTENAEHVDDMNGDGFHDYRDLMVLSERIHVLEDTVGDGVADSTRLFAEGFRTEVTGIAAGVMHHDGEVYATIAPDVWKLRDSNNDGAADEREKLATGFGLHIAYAGHDMHGLTVGPDGKIYWSIGDKGISATSKSGEKFHYPNQGGVMRCNPDGSDFEVFAHGLRNVQELAFDQWGNLFGVDNDADKEGERERFVYIVKGMDAGWRCHYQYRGKDYDPWMAEKLWQPWHEGQPAYIIPPISHSIDGPAGFAFNPGTALSPAYKDYFFLTGAPNGNQIAFQIKPDRASFKMTNEHKVGSGLPIVGINFGPDGGLYGVDWGGGYPLNQTGAVWKLDDAKHVNSAARREVKQRLAEGFAQLATTQLVELLSHADQRLRLGAQFELVKRNARTELAAEIGSSDSLLARVHAIWGLGQLARAGDERAKRVLRETMAADNEPELVAQAIRTLADVPNCEGHIFGAFLSHANPRVRFMAASALGDHPATYSVNGHPTRGHLKHHLPAYAARTEMSETYLRFALSRALAACATDDQLVEWKERNDELSQLAAVVALRRKSSPRLSEFLVGTRDTVATEAALAIHDDFSVMAAMPDLARALTESTCNSEAFVRRAINANFRLGGAENAARLASYVADASRPTEYRLEALSSLKFWKNSPPLDRVTGRARDLRDTDRGVDARVATSLSGLLNDVDPKMRVAALAAASALDLPVDATALTSMARSNSAKSSVRIEALSLLEKQNSGELSELIEFLTGVEDVAVRVEAMRLLTRRKSANAEQIVRRVLAESDELAERQAAAELLGSLSTDSKKLAARLATRAAVGKTPEDRELANIRLELIESAQLQPSEDFTECLSGGDSRRGRELFMTHIGAQCVRCHRVGRQGSDVGPALDGIASRRDAGHLLRAIVSPSADIDKDYQSVTVLLDSGKAIQGVPVRKDDETIVLRDAQGKEVKVNLDEVEEEFAAETSLMPEMTKVLSRREIRDVVAWLKTLRN